MKPKKKVSMKMKQKKHKANLATAEFGQNSDSEGSDCGNTRQMVMQQNRKKKKSGGFQSMGLSHSVFKGVTRKGYKVPTPIQRKCIPLVLDGKDVVAMARTGSGKTAAFLIPMFEKLKLHVSTGCRALILSPTRELALQTLKFTKEIGKYTGLKAAVVLGGDRMEDQFAALHENPDIIIATPGRFMHVLVEMDAKLGAIEYLVFDEADRLFEMGFQEQLQEILKRLPESRQTLLFSATLPKLLVEFARAGLHDPTLVRLDVDTKLSENLKLSFLQCRSEDRVALLLYMLRQVIKKDQQTVVFVATKHHVEYLSMILQEAGILCSYTYSSLDPTARKINVAKFRNKKTNILLVTDLAARGIDIPMLDSVINYNFPAKPKLFVHRVGRVARAGQSGTAYSLITPDEVAYVCDLHLFLGRPLTFVPIGQTQKDKDGLWGAVPRWVIDSEDENLRAWHCKTDLQNMKKVIQNAYKQYCKSRPAPSSESVKRMKQTDFTQIGYHPLFGETNTKGEQAREQLLNVMKNYKPHTTVFEINSTSKSQAAEIMKKKRDYHKGVISVAHQKRLEKLAKNEGGEVEGVQNRMGEDGFAKSEITTDLELQEAFTKVVAPKRRSTDHVYEMHPKKKKHKRHSDSVKDKDLYIEYRPSDYQSERGLSIGTSFENEISTATFDLTGDDQKQLSKMNNTLKWDRKRKKFVRDGGKDGKQKKIKTESGNWISASYRSNVYKDWLNRSRAGENAENSESEDDDGDGGGHTKKKQKRKVPEYNPERLHVIGGHSRKTFHKKGVSEAVPAVKNKFRVKGNRREIKRSEQILKQRKVKAKKEAMQHHRSSMKKKKRAGFSKGKRGS